MQKNLYWIKLYLDIIDDPKMGMLDSETFRWTIHLFLYAGEYGQGGCLPSVDVISWRLRIAEDEILTVLCKLEQFGITSRDEKGNWRITNFAKRQAPVSGADRSRLYRNRRNERDDDHDGDRDDDRDVAGEAEPDISVAQRRNENALNTDTESESETDSESDAETESDTHPEADPVSDELTSGQTYYFRAFKSQPNRSDLLTLAQLEKTHGYHRLTQVIDWAVSSGIPPGRALPAIRTAINNWSDRHRPQGPAGHDRNSGVLEKLSKKYSDGNSS